MSDENQERLNAQFSESELAALRRNVRKRVLWGAQLQISAARFDCIVVDLSLGGARLHFAERIEMGQEVALILDRIGSLRAEVVWQEERSIGVRFTDDPQRIAQLIGGRLPLALPSAISA